MGFYKMNDTQSLTLTLNARILTSSSLPLILSDGINNILSIFTKVTPPVCKQIYSNLPLHKATAGSLSKFNPPYDSAQMWKIR